MASSWTSYLNQFFTTPSNIMFEAWSLGISGNVIQYKQTTKNGKSFEKLISLIFCRFIKIDYEKITIKNTNKFL